ncbi:MAG: ABC transporter ATP-binding protein [Thaumarchaeota archaeon]|nr:ABC transporter ATP-binding protein [Nitrososphaerota archaeon]
MDAIVVENLTKYYGDLLAVNGISFSVKWGELFGFLGPNGAGKTTTVRMLCGLTKISSGEAYVAGYSPIRELKLVKKVIGLVPDTSNLYPELTCWDNLIFTGEMYGLGREERVRRARELLEFFGLLDKKDSKFDQLSKGQKRKLTLAAALMHRPRILFLDEPTIGLDVRSRRMIWNMIRELNESGLTIFLTTHNIYEAFNLCDRIAVINRGEIIANGSPAELKRRFSGSEVLEVSFDGKMSVEEISRIPGVIKASRSGESFMIVVSDPLSVMEEIVRKAKSKGISLNYVNLRGADAEEVFLRIIGDADA